MFVDEVLVPLVEPEAGVVEGMVGGLGRVDFAVVILITISLLNEWAGASALCSKK